MILYNVPHNSSLLTSAARINKRATSVTRFMCRLLRPKAVSACTRAHDRRVAVARPNRWALSIQQNSMRRGKRDTRARALRAHTHTVSRRMRYLFSFYPSTDPISVPSTSAATLSKRRCKAIRVINIWTGQTATSPTLATRIARAPVRSAAIHRKAARHMYTAALRRLQQRRRPR